MKIYILTEDISCTLVSNAYSLSYLLDFLGLIAKVVDVLFGFDHHKIYGVSRIMYVPIISINPSQQKIGILWLSIKSQ